MKLWEKGTAVNEAIEKFTVGKDRELDVYLAPYDILGSMAHVTMLGSVGLIEKDELPVLLDALKKLYRQATDGNFINHLDNQYIFSPYGIGFDKSGNIF